MKTHSTSTNKALALIMIIAGLANAATDGNTSVQINKVWAEHNVELNNEKGMILHINFSAENMYGKEGYVGVWFKENGRQLSFARKEHFNNSEPYYKDFSYEDFKLFIPYSFDVQGYGKHDLKMEIYIADAKANSALARDSLNLTYTNSAPQYQQQYQQPYQQQQPQRNEVVEALDAFNAVLNTIVEINNQYQYNKYQQNQYQYNQYQNNQYQNYQQDNGQCQARYDKWANYIRSWSSYRDKGIKANVRKAQREMRHLRTGNECRGKIVKSPAEDL
jgi:hypothetical protein